jgi:ATP-binding cassette subfamily B protein
VVLFLRYLRLYHRQFMLGLAALVATNGLTLAIPWMLKGAVEALERAAPLRQIARYAVLICLTALVLSVVRTWSRWLILGASRHVVCDLRDSLFAHLQTLPASFYGRHRTGDLMSRAVNDLRLVRSMFGPGVLNAVNVALLYGVGLALMLLLDPLMTGAAVLPYPLLLLGVFRVSRTIHERSNLAQDRLAAISARAQENLSGINQVKAYVREEDEIASFSRLSGEYRERSLELARSRGLIVSLMDGLGGLSRIAVFGLGGWQVIDGALSLGGFVAFWAYLGLLTGPTIMMGWMVGVFQRGLGAIRRIDEIQSAQSDLPGDRITAPAVPLSGRVTLRNLGFAYPGVGRPVLRDLTLDVAPGTIVGIVGRVGAGKSTLVQLLGAVHASPDGALLIDGRDINAIPTDQLRAHVGMVPQETFLFSRSLAENIALGRPGCGRAAIERAAQAARLEDDLRRFPRGLDAIVGERGITLSGGQRQRVALARALLLEPRILILDDALSSVDADTERAILAGLGEFFRRRTTFIVAHRVSTVSGADRIVVLEEGRIVEDGAPGDLLARDGHFARMRRQQQIETELEAM